MGGVAGFTGSLGCRRMCWKGCAEVSRECCVVCCGRAEVARRTIGCFMNRCESERKTLQARSSQWQCTGGRWAGQIGKQAEVDFIALGAMGAQWVGWRMSSDTGLRARTVVRGGGGGVMGAFESAVGRGQRRAL